MTRSLFQDSQGAVWVGRRDTRPAGQNPGWRDPQPGAAQIRGAGRRAGDGRGRGGRAMDRHGRQRIVALEERAVHALLAGDRAGQRSDLGAPRGSRRHLMDRQLRGRLDAAQGGAYGDVHHAARAGGRRDLLYRRRWPWPILVELAPGHLPGEQEGIEPVCRWQAIPQVHCVAYGKSDGLPTLECKGGFQPAGCRGRDGRLWFPTVGGVVVVDPAETRARTPSRRRCIWKR